MPPTTDARAARLAPEVDDRDVAGDERARRRRPSRPVALTCSDFARRRRRGAAARAPQRGEQQRRDASRAPRRAARASRVTSARARPAWNELLELQPLARHELGRAEPDRAVGVDRELDEHEHVAGGRRRADRRSRSARGGGCAAGSGDSPSHTSNSMPLLVVLARREHAVLARRHDRALRDHQLALAARRVDSDEPARRDVDRAARPRSCPRAARPRAPRRPRRPPRGSRSRSARGR